MHRKIPARPLRPTPPPFGPEERARPARSARRAVSALRALGALVVLSVLCAAPASAQVRAATLFPSGAQVTESTLVTPDADGVAVLRLPAAADPATLRLALGGGVQLADVSWKREAPGDAPRVAELRRALERAEAARDATAADLDATQAQIAFWKRQGAAGELKAQDAARLAEAVAQALPGLARDAARLARETQERERAVTDAKAALQRATGGDEAAWLVEVALARPASGALKSPVPVTWTYRARGCGWRPVYTLDALPRADVVRFAFQAEIWQATGADWKGADLTLATLEPRAGLTPPDLAPWILRPRPEARVMKSARNMAAGAAPAMDGAVLLEATAAAPMAAPEMALMGTYAAWKLGARDLAAGKRPRVTLESADWKAEFTYTVRPSVAPEAFLTASVTLDKPMELPEGEALYMVDGAVLGRRAFGNAERTLDLFFGSDPLVATDMRMEDHHTGARGVFDKQRTFSWKWTITTRNNKPYAVSVRIEDPRPVPRDERIRVTTTSQPPAQTDEDTLFWAARLQPGQALGIVHEVAAEAPADMDVLPGR